ncbi:MAG: CBS domain-containing protein [Euryarchaeota archaeon]|nr:CBS domain-containing protein [Euryarchaeota archaeon]
MSLSELRAKDVMIRELLTITPEERVAAARLRMVRNNIGALPVVEGDILVGIITHRDTTLVEPNGLLLKVRDIMSKNIITITKETTLKEITNIMKQTGFQRLPVVENKKLVGLVTQSCIINAIADSL